MWITDNRLRKTGTGDDDDSEEEVSVGHGCSRGHWSDRGPRMRGRGTVVLMEDTHDATILQSRLSPTSTASRVFGSYRSKPPLLRQYIVRLWSGCLQNYETWISRNRQSLACKELRMGQGPHSCEKNSLYGWMSTRTPKKTRKRKCLRRTLPSMRWNALWSRL